ncbi:hypothetical protein F441_11179 [Phytophthora nicotianae CJ01A1]|uniref:Reverse transcriptase Ty1/copia-type domain-containing protein n=4 Tax=Phytophthora nicotianae TaxID=4792 RepID=W2Q4M8_PHYN3|nr:hypothetical protein PPTG_23198 [Phytophthora nicotianae INRA-310]ETI43950.1 hypothetical protein F443_11261 [Phytophthora nicotianae P1569]ETN07499.1 hypothetical protein PPTG_23198 [Phytophthora nicotianae INRA-310]ETP13805.1 hypothetical protein F441_11179 [Phytophthora nicotianae CJ01A1]
MTISWECEKQTFVALSTTEAEYVAGTDEAQELLGVKELVGEIGLKMDLPMVMHMDNQAAIAQVTSEASSATTKHMDVKLKFIQDSVQKGELKPQYAESDSMLADLLTKPLAATRAKDMREAIGLTTAAARLSIEALGRSVGS